MPCTTEIIAIEEVSDGEIVVTLRCCDDPKTDSKHTINLVAQSSEDANTYIARTPADVESLIQELISKSEARHTAKLNARSCIQDLQARIQAAKALRLQDPSNTNPTTPL